MTDTRDYQTVERLHPENADRVRAEKYRAALENVIAQLTMPSEFPMIQMQIAMQIALDALEGYK